MKTSTPTPTPRPALKATGMRRRHARCLETELAALTAERDQLRAELAAEREKVTMLLSDAYALTKNWHDRAERAETELATERARTKQIATALTDAISTYFGADKPMYSSYSQNVFKLCVKGRDARRAAIDAAEVERLKRDYEYDHKCLHEVRERCESWKQRAERAEAELAKYLSACPASPTEEERKRCQQWWAISGRSP